MLNSGLSGLTQEVRSVQNPALGAMLVWRFATAYTKASKTSEHVPLPLCFVVLPILLHERTASLLRSTQTASGLRAFTAKFGDSRNVQQDVLLAIHERALRLRKLTLESLSVGHATKLISVRTDGYVMALTSTAPKTGVPEAIRRLLKDAEKLGTWCGQLTLHEIGIALKVAF